MARGKCPEARSVGIKLRRDEEDRRLDDLVGVDGSRPGGRGTLGSAEGDGPGTALGSCSHLEMSCFEYYDRKVLPG